MDILGSILNNVDHSVIITDRDGSLLFFNREAEQTAASLNKYPLKLGEPLLSYASRERRKIIRDIIADLTRHKRSVKSLAEYKQLNGLPMHLELNYTPIIDESEN